MLDYETSLSGTPRIPYLNWNGDERRLSTNDARNEWNDNNRFLFVRNYISLLTAPLGAVSLL